MQTWCRVKQRNVFRIVSVSSFAWSVQDHGCDMPKFNRSLPKHISRQPKSTPKNQDQLIPSCRWLSDHWKKLVDFHLIPDRNNHLTCTLDQSKDLISIWIKVCFVYVYFSIVGWPEPSNFSKTSTAKRTHKITLEKTQVHTIHCKKKDHLTVQLHSTTISKWTEFREQHLQVWLTIYSSTLMKDKHL